MTVSNISSVGGNDGPIEPAKPNTPHFQELQLTRVDKEEANEPSLGDPNFLLLGTIFITLVVFTAVPVLYLVAIVGLNEFDKASNAAAADLTPPGDGAPIANGPQNPIKKKKQVGLFEVE